MHIPWNNTVNTFMHLFHLNLKNCQTQKLDSTWVFKRWILTHLVICEYLTNYHNKLFLFYFKLFRLSPPEEINTFKKHKIFLLPLEVTKFRTTQMLRLVKNPPVFYCLCQVNEQNLLLLRTYTASLPLCDNHSSFLPVLPTVLHKISFC